MSNLAPTNVVPTSPDAAMGPERRVNTETWDSQFRPEAVTLPDGGYIVAWQQ
jgi:hypothetical protein